MVHSFDCSSKCNILVNEKLNNQDFNSAIHHHLFGNLGMMAIFTNDHYLSLVYRIGFAEKSEEIKYLYLGI